MSASVSCLSSWSGPPGQGAATGLRSLVLFPILIWGLTWGDAAAAADMLRTLDQADFLVSDAVTPPGDDAGNWTPVALPDFWTRTLRAERQGRESGWYRLQITLADPPAQRLAIYLPRLSMNAAVYLNGELIGNGGSMEPPVARNWNRPLLFVVPTSLWQPGTNRIHIRLRVSDNGAGVLAPVKVGAVEDLQPRFEKRLFLQSTVSVGLFFITIAVALFMLGLWVRLRHETIYLLFGAAALTWSLYSLNLFTTRIPVPVSVWWMLVHGAIDFWIVLLALFAHRFTGVRRPRLEIGMLLFAVSGLVLYGALTPAGAFNRMNAYWHLGTTAIGGYITVLLIRHWLRTRSAEMAAFATMMVAILLLGARDWLMNSGRNPQMWLDNFHTLHFVAPLMFLVMTWHLTSRFIHALHQSRQMNERLHAGIAAARAELEIAHAEQAQLARERAAAQERERLLRDLHDDVGARLLSLIHRSESEQSAQLAREVLDEIRRVASRPPDQATSLLALLDALEVENRERLAAAGLTLDWSTDPAVPDIAWTSGQSQDVARVIREAVSNVLHHADARSVRVHAGMEAGALTIGIADDGRTPIGERPDPGNGIRNMRQRIAKLRGTIDWYWQEARGCRVVMRIPLD